MNPTTQDNGAGVLPDAQRTYLYVLLLRHSKTSMAETVVYLAGGESVTQIGRRRTCLGGDARAIENIVYGHLRHNAPTWVRRTRRLARALQSVEGLDPDVARNSEAVLAEADVWSLVFEDMKLSQDLRALV